MLRPLQEVKGRIPPAGRDRQQVGDQANSLSQIVGCLGQHRFQLVKPLLGRVLAPESGGPFQLRDGWIERTVLMVR
jgi:hypothetical protein